MPLITVNLPSSLSHSLVGLLERLVTAVERLAGPEFEHRPLPPSTLQDYGYVTPEEVDRVRQAEMNFAAGHMLVPGSPAFLAAIAEFEAQVADAYGEDAVQNLPWKTPVANPPSPQM